MEVEVAMAAVEMVTVAVAILAVVVVELAMAILAHLVVVAAEHRAQLVAEV